MRKMITLSLPTEVVGEILNHLEDGVEVWRNTEEYLSGGCVVTPCFVAECSSIRKARRMMTLYEETISLIEKTVKTK